MCLDAERLAMGGERFPQMLRTGIHTDAGHINVGDSGSRPMSLQGEQRSR